MSTPTQRDERFMREALVEAERPGWRTHPNPQVGAVLVKNDQIIARGFHEAPGRAHAEVAALRQLHNPRDAEGAEIFVTLEPCHHTGRTGPCTEVLLESGVSRCIIGHVDPDPRVSGKGIAALREAGIECVVGVLEADSKRLNEAYLKRVLFSLPFVTVKVAVSLDGKIATRARHSRWITGKESREEVHRMRDQHDAILVGTKTLLDDNPELTCRLPEGGRNPLRVVLDRKLRAPLSRKAFAEQDKAPTLVFTGRSSLQLAKGRFEGSGVEVLGASELGGVLDLEEILHQLAARGVTTLMCEGGSELIAGLLGRGLVDRFVSFIAPKIIGGSDAPGPVSGLGFETMAEAAQLDIERVDRFGDDVRIVARYRVDNTLR